MATAQAIDNKITLKNYLSDRPCDYNNLIVACQTTPRKCDGCYIFWSFLHDGASRR